MTERRDEQAPQVWGGGCECWVTPEHMWTTHYGAVEPGSQVEFNPNCPEHGGRPDKRPDAVGRSVQRLPQVAQRVPVPEHRGGIVKIQDIGDPFQTRQLRFNETQIEINRLRGSSIRLLTFACLMNTLAIVTLAVTVAVTR